MNYLKTPWTSQPQQAVGIDWSNPITRGLVNAVNIQGSNPAYNLVLGANAPTGGTLTPSAFGGGYGKKFSSAAIQFPRSAYTGAETMLSVCRPTTVDANWRAIMHRRNTTTIGTAQSGATMWVLAYDNSAGLRLTAWQSSGATCVDINSGSANIAANETFTAVGVVPGNGLTAAIYKNGNLVGSATQSADMVNAVVTTEVGGMHANNTSRYFVGDQSLALHWNRALSDSEIRSISQNPWQIFRPLPRRIFVPVSAVSSDTLLYPTKGSLVTSGYVPTITQPGTDTTLSPTKGSLAITGKTPTLAQPNALSPSKAAAIFSGKQPTIDQTANQTLSPSKVSLVFSGKIPTIDQTAANSILPGTGHYYTTGKTPTITQPNSLAPSKRAVSLTGYQPTVLQSFSINPTTGAVVITGKTPSITQPNAITPLVAHAILTGKTPIISDSTPMTDSQKLDLIIDILSNKQTLNPTTGIYTLYADDGTTVLMTAQAWEDAAGTIPYRGKALQRLDAMS